MRLNWISVGDPPPRLVVAQPPPELRHRWLPRYLVNGFPSMRGLELSPGKSRDHVESVRPELVRLRDERRIYFVS
jgi:hypothetical protein